MSQLTPVQGWSELLLALPEFILTDARIDEHDELELKALLGREVDLRTAGGLSPYFRDEVVANARVLYDAA